MQLRAHGWHDGKMTPSTPGFHRAQLFPLNETPGDEGVIQE